MATYEDKKRMAIGFVAEPADPFDVSSIFSVAKKNEIMEASGHLSFFKKEIEEQIDRQLSLKTALSVWDEYEKDKVQAGKNFAELKEFLQENIAAKIELLLSRKPAAEWLNVVFLENTEIDDLMHQMKNASADCKTIIADAIRKELVGLVHFKALFEQILKDVTDTLLVR